MLLAVIWLTPLTWRYAHSLTDLVMFIAWIIDYALLVSHINSLGCGSIWAWDEITYGSTCARWKAAVAFSFLSAMFWLMNGLLVRSRHIL